MSFNTTRRFRYRVGFEDLESRIALAADLAGALGDVACEVLPTDSGASVGVIGETESHLLTVRQTASEAEVWGAELNGANNTMLASTPGQIGRNSFVHNDQLYFTVVTGDGILGTDPVQLWVSNGTETGTKFVSDLGAWDLFGQAVSVEFHDAGEQLLMKVTQGFVDSAESHLWVTDGTAEGTSQYSVRYTGMSDGIQSVASANGSWLYDGQELSGGQTNYGLYATDPVQQTTESIRSFESTVDELVAAGDAAFFVATENGDQELWVSDGTAEGTIPLLDINETGSSSPRDLVVAGDTLFFMANDGTNGRELWASDGTAAGTSMVADLNTSGSTDIQYMVAAGSTLFFTVRNTDNTIDLWTSEGQGSADLVATLPGSIQTFTDGFSFPTSAGASLFFVVSTEEAGSELWTSDGSAEGTGLAVDVNPGVSGSNPFQLTPANDRLLFVAKNENGESGVWSVDVETDIGSLTTVLLGDADGSGEVDFKDFLVVSRNYGQDVDDGAASGDLDENGKVEFNDFLILSGNFGQIG